MIKYLKWSFKVLIYLIIISLGIEMVNKYFKIPEFIYFLLSTIIGFFSILITPSIVFIFVITSILLWFIFG